MAKIYVRKIKNNEINPVTGDVWTLEDVPELWRDEVENLLNEDSFIENGF